MIALIQTSTIKHGVVRIEEWPEGLVLWVGGEIAWKQWEHPRDVVTLKLQLDTKAVRAVRRRPMNDAELEHLKKSHAKLLKAAKAGASAIDTLLGDSDLDDDTSPEFKACVALNRAIEFAEGTKGRTGRVLRSRSNT